MSPEEVNNDRAGWGWTGMEIAQAVPTPGLPAATGDSTTHQMKQSGGNSSSLFSWAAYPVPVGDIRRAGSRGAGTGCAGWELLHRGAITPALGLKPRPGSVLPPLEGNISPPQPASSSPPFQSGNSQCIPSKNTAQSQMNRNPHEKSPSAWRRKSRQSLISTSQRWRL